MSKKRRSDEEAILIAVCELVKGATLLKAGRSVKNKSRIHFVSNFPGFVFRVSHTFATFD